MPPTIQHAEKREDRPDRSSSSSSSSRKRAGAGGGERRSDLVARVKYNNTLPDIPFDAKFITYPFDSNRFINYRPTSLERNYKYELLAEPDIGIGVDLINPDTYACPADARLDLADEKLLEEETATPTDSKRSKQHAKNISWLRRTEYISTEYNRFNTISGDNPETKLGGTLKQSLTEEDLYRDRDSQINAIYNTFEAAQKPIDKHYSKPGAVHPVEVLSLFPDFKMWRHPCAQVIFDADPAARGQTGGRTQVEEMSQALIRGMMDESGDQFVAYFLPKQDTMEKRKIDAVDEVDYDPVHDYEYGLAREYNWSVKNKLTKGYEENYFFVFRHGDGAYYNELETRVRLTKRRKLGHSVQSNNSVLAVKHRDFHEQETRTQEARLTQLQPPSLDDDDNQPTSTAAALLMEGGADETRDNDDTKNDDETAAENEMETGSGGERGEEDSDAAETGAEKKPDRGREDGGAADRASESPDDEGGQSSDDNAGNAAARQDGRVVAEDIFGSDSDSGSGSGSD